MIKGRIRIKVTADLNINASVAKRLVDIQLMLKVRQMIMAGEPELLIDGQNVFWKVPFLVVPPEDDPNIYPTGKYALVDAFSGIYILGKKDIEELKVAAFPILKKFYPDVEKGLEFGIPFFEHQVIGENRS